MSVAAIGNGYVSVGLPSLLQVVLSGLTLLLNLFQH